MRKLVLICVLMVPWILKSQSRIDEIYSTIRTDESIVKESGANEYILCNSDGSQSIFYWVSFAANPSVCKMMPMQSGFIVSDFVIEGDWVVFCGTISGRGAVGWFKCSDISNGGSVNAYIATFVSPSINTGFYHRGFRKMTIYSIGTEYHAIMIGYGDDPGRESTLMELIFKPSVFASTIYYQFLTSGDGIEMFESVTNSEDYVMSSGRKKFQAYPGYRRFDKPQSASSQYIFNTSNQWHIYNRIEVDPLSPTYATSAGGNRLMVLLDATNIYVPVSSPVYYALCEVVHGTAYNCRYLYTENVTYNIFGLLRGAKGASNGDVHVMQDVYVGSTPRSLIYNMFFGTGYISSMGLYDQTNYLQSIDMINLGTSGKVVSTRTDSSGGHFLMYQHTNSSNSGCMSQYQLKLCADSVKVVEIVDNRPKDEGSVDVSIEPYIVSPCSITPICNSQP